MRQPEDGPTSTLTLVDACEAEEVTFSSQVGFRVPQAVVVASAMYSLAAPP